MDVVADLPADAQSAEPMQQRERPLDDPAVPAQPGAVPGATADADPWTRLRYLWWSYARSANTMSGRRRGRPRRPCTGETASISGIS